LKLGLKGKVALITGATGGLGAACARALAEEGALLFLSSRTDGKLEELAGHVKRAGGSDARWLAADLTSPQAAQAVAEAARRAFDFDQSVAGRHGVAVGDLPVENQRGVNFPAGLLNPGPAAEDAGCSADDARPRFGGGVDQLGADVAGADVFTQRRGDVAFDDAGVWFHIAQYMFKVAADHWLCGARRLASPNADSRADPADITLVVIHGISLPPGEFGTGMVEALFTNALDVSVQSALADLRGLRVSSHLLVSRRGAVTQFVPFHRRAWHAGASSHQGRVGCNDFAIGIELEGEDRTPYAEVQYRVLGEVLEALFSRYPRLSLAGVVGHAEIAPGRKTDPGPAFDWPRLFRSLRR